MGTGSQQNLSLIQLQQKENKSIFAIQSQRHLGNVQGIPPVGARAASKGGRAMNADLGDLEEVLTENYQVGTAPRGNSTRPPVGRPPQPSRPAKKTNDTLRKSSEVGGTIARIKTEAERSRQILEKQAALEKKRKLLSAEQAISGG